AACTQVKGHTLARLQGSREAGRDGQQAGNLSLLQERLTLSRINPIYAKASIFGQCIEETAGHRPTLVQIGDSERHGLIRVLAVAVETRGEADQDKGEGDGQDK